MNLSDWTAIISIIVFIFGLGVYFGDLRVWMKKVNEHISNDVKIRHTIEQSISRLSVEMNHRIGEVEGKIEKNVKEIEDLKRKVG